MPDILHRVGIDAPARKVFGALSTLSGLRRWWVTDAEGDPALGGNIDFHFAVMKVVKSDSPRLVHWKCIRGPREWIGTEVTFRLQRKEGQTYVNFTHVKWRRAGEFMSHCSTKWATFLLSLKDWIERGEGRPAPYDVKIHLGD